MKKRANAGVRVLAALVLCAFSTTAAYALPAGGGGPVDPHVMDCVKRTVVSFSANPTTISFGASATLSWSVNIPADCVHDLTSFSVNGTPVALSGSQVVQPMIDTEYDLQVVAGRVAATLGAVTLTVQVPNVVYINGSTGDWKKLLVAALGRANTTIYLAPSVDMDLSGYQWISVAAGVSVIGGEPCPMMSPQSFASGKLQISSTLSTGAPSSTAITQARSGIVPPVVTRPVCGGRSSREFGPRLYTSTRPNGLFVISCEGDDSGDDVRFTGFRIQGPRWDSADDRDLEKGIMIHSCNNIDIGNMELSGWSGAAIKITDEPGRQTGPEAVKIHDSFIHHNQHIGGDGYGVDVSSGAWATIERNVFDFNRHAVTAGTVWDAIWKGGYVANQNLILKGGGYHGKWYESYTQQFDVHGSKDCLATSGTWNCGRSGKEYHITNNAFQYTNGRDFRLRGTPLNGAFVDNNVIAHQNIDDAVDTSGHGTIGLFVGPNRTGLDTFGKYGVCDFDGDEHDDLFLATGASWWYMSSAKRQWTYLNSYTDTLDQLALGDFTGSGRCDVFAVHGNEWMISRGGSGPWESLGTFNVPFDQLRFGHFTGGSRTEIFRRAPDGQWWLISPGVFDWRPLGSSSLPLNQLHFGVFNGNHVTDVLALTGGQWSVSRGGASSWQPLNMNMHDGLGNVLIADLDGKGVDDVVRYNFDSQAWEVSVAGRTGWQRLAAQNWLWTAGGAFVGHFDGSRGAQILSISIAELPSYVSQSALQGFEERRGSIFSRTTGTFTPYGIYAY